MKSKIIIQGSLVQFILGDLAAHSPQYFMDHTILYGCNDDVNKINNL